MDKRFTFRDEEGYYTDSGAGEAVLLVHGYCADGRIWEGLNEQLAQHYRVLVPDLPGYSNSALLKGTTTIVRYAEWLKALLDDAGTKKVHYVGHSMGGYIGMEFANMFPEKLLTLTMFHSHPFADDAEKQAGRKKVIQFVEKHNTALFVKELYNNLFTAEWKAKHSDIVEGCIERASDYPKDTVIASTRAMLNRRDTSEVLRSINVPVQFIIGRLDTSIPYERSLKQTWLPPMARVQVLNNCGHMGMLEAPEQTLELLSDFFNLRLNQPVA